MKTHSILAVAAGVAALACLQPGTATASPLKIELPTETAALKLAPGLAVAQAQCMTCHSADYLSIQPAFPRPAWKATVEKMQKKYGAPIPNEQIEALVDYLVQGYGTPTPKPVSVP